LICSGGHPACRIRRQLAAWCIATPRDEVRMKEYLPAQIPGWKPDTAGWEACRYIRRDV